MPPPRPPPPPTSMPPTSTSISTPTSILTPTPMSPPHHRRSLLTDADPDADDPTSDNLVNMYFLILAAFAILLIATLYYWRRNKRTKALASLGSRRTALAADLQLRERNRAGNRGRANASGIEEGELHLESEPELEGEAPPPYVQMPERARSRLPKYEELEEADPTGVARARSRSAGNVGREQGQGQGRQAVRERGGNDGLVVPSSARASTLTLPAPANQGNGNGADIDTDSGGGGAERARSVSVQNPI